MLAAAILSAGAEASAQRVVLIVADGAGVTHWTLAAFASDDLAIDRFPVSGLMDTRGADHVVTGSAAAATALAIGERTFFGSIGMGPDSLPRETVLEAAAARGLATGLVTTTAIIDATPAAFAAHSIERGAYPEISLEMARKGINVLMGGGRVFFEPARRPDRLDLVAELRGRTTYVETSSELAAIDRSTTKLVGLFARGDMGSVRDRSPDLPAMAEMAFAVLDHDPDGFFLLIENEETDTRAHRNESAEAITEEMLDLDRVIQIALDYRHRHPETLIVVTGDHETGGATLTPTPTRDPVLEYSTTDHTAAFIPVFAIGPGAERFGGLIENQEVGRLLLQAVRGELSP